jgi:hypothetical protein
MEFKGTQGEWKAVFQEHVFPRVECKNFNQGHLSCSSSTNSLENRSNAQLIAAAPELLEEHIMDLEHLKTWRSKLINAGLRGEILWEEYIDMIEAKEKAINKALGL